MNLEISIEASNPLKKDLLAGLTDLIPEQHIVVTHARFSSSRFVLNIHIEVKNPDNLLREIAAIVARTEYAYADEPGIDVYVRNTGCAEPIMDTYNNDKRFSPVPGIRIVPWNDTMGKEPAAHDIFLDPAHAFGTGLHPSTRLCLHFLKQAACGDFSKKYTSGSVLDIGCGSGILTLAAIRLGAARAVGIEVDPGSACIARRNIEINRLKHSARVVETSYHDVTGHYDIVLANLVPSVLFKAATSIANLVTPGGLLITAGFPASKNTKVLQLFAESGLRQVHESSAEAWGALMLVKY